MPRLGESASALDLSGGDRRARSEHLVEHR